MPGYIKTEDLDLSITKILVKGTELDISTGYVLVNGSPRQWFGVEVVGGEITTQEYDALNLTALAYDSYDLTAQQFDENAKGFLT